MSSGAIILYTSWCFCRDSGSLRSYFEFNHLIPDNYCEILAEFHECTETLVSDLFAQHTCLCLFVCLLVGWLVGWLAGWLAGWLVGWLVGLLVGWLVFVVAVVVVVVVVVLGLVSNGFMG